jgi:hypothetical protein
MTVKLKTEEPFLGRIFAQAKGKECEARGTARQHDQTLIYAPDIFAYFSILAPWSEQSVLSKINVSSTFVGYEFFSNALLSDFFLVNSFTFRCLTRSSRFRKALRLACCPLSFVS